MWKTNKKTTGGKEENSLNKQGMTALRWKKLDIASVATWMSPALVFGEMTVYF